MESNLPLVPATNFAKHKIQIKLIKEKNTFRCLFHSSINRVPVQFNWIARNFGAAVCSAVQCSGSQFVSGGPVYPAIYYQRPPICNYGAGSGDGIGRRVAIVLVPSIAQCQRCCSGYSNVRIIYKCLICPLTEKGGNTGQGTPDSVTVFACHREMYSLHL